MADVPASARVVVIGAGIVGNSLVYHLAELGWRDIVQIDKGPLPNPGGSTGHASNFIFPVDHSREITDLTLDSVRQYQEMGVFTESGGFEVARTEERMEELRRRMSSGQGVGHRGRAGHPRRGRRRRCRSSRTTSHHRRLLDPERRRRRLAARRHDHARAGAGAGRADRRPQRRGRSAWTSRTAAITRVAHRPGRHRGRARRHRLRRVEPQDRPTMAGAHIPLTPAVHQMICVGPCPQLAEQRGRDHLPDRAGHGHLLLRAPARRRHGGRLLRPPRDPARRRGHPLDRAGQALPDRDALHRGRLRPAARAGLRADARAARRRGRGDPLRHQRPALADPATASRSSARRPRSQGLWSPPRSGSRRARASAARSPSG